MKILKFNEYKKTTAINESIITSFIKKLVHRIVNSKTNNETFDYYGHSVNIQSGTRDYADITIDGSISFSIDYLTLDLHFENTGDWDEKMIDEIVSAFHNELDTNIQSVKVSFDKSQDEHYDNGYKLTEKDVEYLKECGYKDDDIKLIQQCLDDDGFMMTDRLNKRIDAETAIKMVGKEDFLSGLGRSCFHWSAMRGEGKNTVDFDTSDWHKKYSDK